MPKPAAPTSGASEPAAPKHTFEWRPPTAVAGEKSGHSPFFGGGTGLGEHSGDAAPQPANLLPPRLNHGGGSGSQQGNSEPAPKPKWQDLLVRPPKPEVKPLEQESSPRPDWQGFFKPRVEPPAPKQGQEPQLPARPNWSDLLGGKPQGQQGDGSQPAEPKWKSWIKGGEQPGEGNGMGGSPFGEPKWKNPDQAPSTTPAPQKHEWSGWPGTGFGLDGEGRELLDTWQGKPSHTPDALPWWKPGSTAAWPEWAAHMGQGNAWQREWQQNALGRWENWWDGEGRHGWWTRPTPVQPRWPYVSPERHVDYNFNFYYCNFWGPGYPHRWRPWGPSGGYFPYWHEPWPHYYYGHYCYYPWWYDDGLTIVINLGDDDHDYYYEPIYYERDRATVRYQQEYGYDDDYPYYPEGTSQALGDALRDIALSWLAKDPELLSRHLSASRPIDARDEEQGYQRVLEPSELLDLVTVALDNIETERFCFTNVDESQLDQAWAEARHLYREDGVKKEAYIHYHLVREYGEWYVDAIMVKSEQE